MRLKFIHTIITGLLLCLAFALTACSDDDLKKPDSGVSVDLALNPDIGQTDGPVAGDSAKVDAPVKVDGAVVKDTGTPKDTGKKDTGTPKDAASQSDSIAAAKCGGKDKVVLQEVAVGNTDFVALKNTGTTSVTLKGFKLVMTGISVSAPDVFTFTTQTIASGKVLYVMEYSTGTKTGDVNTGKNIPFYNGPPSAAKPNSVSLMDGSGNLLDYMSVGSNVNMPKGATFTPVAWPTSFDSSKSSFQRKASKGACPAFLSSDWGAATLTR